MIDGMVQGQLALYEQFLTALQGTVVSAKASGATITPQVLRQARNEFELRSGRTEEWMARERSDFYRQIMMLMEVEDETAEPYLNDWVVSVELMIGRRQPNRSNRQARERFCLDCVLAWRFEG